MYYIIPVICLVVVCILKRTEVESVLKKKKIDVAPKISPFSDSDKCSKKVKTTKLRNSSGPDFHLGSANSESVPSYSRATVIQHNENRPSTSSGSQGNVSRW